MSNGFKLAIITHVEGGPGIKLKLLIQCQKALGVSTTFHLFLFFQIFVVRQTTENRGNREEKNISQSELARLLSVHHSIIGKYERDEVKPSIDVVKILLLLWIQQWVIF
ncbi:helix-turn-helix domain-containing protein [Terrimonas pollutisoli]|uniref:helix-turn-helix domain-containing protein n=1 Tax=Terrimonas pollutisoli TaxID=3034147 RepID=UPI0034DFE5A6